ncbi:alpha/beta fold hydrolase [Amycolatopsis rhabdoformis]|uniref:Alpha/beta fold hydrolase n=1 Tax=Amycolatopsis rhabdoformis TaxID=1448059 RepID=A0ABZ1IG61_9PSEU|nr:alpha/beta fold hydrolase [Amycolatopsis rhabdoformis]WSE33247.1 alpha/beta fold hydrolase [Amycolatopsis rhabdoformis]
MPAEAPAGLEEITVATPDGASLALRVLAHPDAAAPVALILPAMAIKAKFYLPLVKALHAAGLSAVVADLRAQGASTPALGAGPGFGYRELIETDLPAVVSAVRTRFPAAPLHLFGHSVGGQLALLYAAAEPDRVASVTTIGTGSVYWRSFPAARRLSILATTQWVGLVCRLRGNWPGGGGIGPMTGGVMADWVRHARTSRYRPRGSSRDYDRLLGELSLPLLVISLDNDPLGPETTVRFLCRCLPSADLTRWHLDSSSGLKHLGHASWIKDSDLVGPAVAAWITAGKAPA